MDDSVANGIRQNGVTDLFSPSGNIELGAEDCGFTHLRVPTFYHKILAVHGLAAAMHNLRGCRAQFGRFRCSVSGGIFIFNKKMQK